MAILINELVFKGTIAAPAPDKKPATTNRQPATDLKTLVETCVEEVLRILEQRKER